MDYMKCQEDHCNNHKFHAAPGKTFKNPEVKAMRAAAASACGGETAFAKEEAGDHCE